MSLEEALAWLRGERSSINIQYAASDDRNHASACAAREDAAACEQAYWVVRAHKEGLL